LLARICVLYDQFCISRMYQRSASRNKRMYSADGNSSNSTYELLRSTSGWWNFVV